MTTAPVEALDLDEPGVLEEDDENLSALAVNGRHASLWTLTELLHRIVVGRLAARLVEEGDLPVSGGLFVPESFGWMCSKINVGRKDNGRNGERLSMPVRLEWSEPLAVLTENTELVWSTLSMGHDESGVCKVVLDDVGFEDQVEKDEFGVPVFASVVTEPERVLRQRLTVIAEEGEMARWELRSLMAPRVRLMLRRAHFGVSHEVCAFQGMPDRLLLDEVALESVITDFLYGVEGRIGKLDAIVEKILTPESMRRVDPLRYVNRAVRRDAAEAIRQRVGDPRIGRRIRDVARDLDLRDVESVVAAVRDLYPKDKVSTDRVAAALSVQPDPMSGCLSMTRSDGFDSDFVDEDSDGSDGWLSGGF